MPLDEVNAFLKKLDDEKAATEFVRGCSRLELLKLVEHKTGEGYGAVHLAARQGMAGLMHTLLALCPAEALRPTAPWCKAASRTALHIATQGGSHGANADDRAAVVRELLKTMDWYSLNAVTPSKRNTALHHAAVTASVAPCARK